MNGSPAPLYIIMVDHGNQDTFYIDPDTISPAELDLWMKHLELGPNLDGVNGLKRPGASGEAGRDHGLVLLGKLHQRAVVRRDGDERRPDRDRVGSRRRAVVQGPERA